jgi:hypothetical protein
VPVRLPYSAPERIENRAWGGPADIFALGAVAFELVTGQRIAGPGAPSLWADNVPGADVNALSDVFGRALALEPSARFASASDLVDALRPILARTQVSTAVAPPATATEEASDAVLPLPAFVSGGEGQTIRYDSGQEHEDDVSADLPLIASAGSAPLFDAAADDRPGFFPARDHGEDAEPGGPFLDVRAAPPARPASNAMSGPLWSDAQPDAVSARRPFLPLIVALLVGVAGGFAWGYWTAWRAAVREVPAAAGAQVPGATSPAPPSAATTPERVEEPRVLGEGTAAPERAAPQPSTAAPRAAAEPAAPQARRERRAAQTAARATAANTRPSGEERARTRTPAATTGSLLVDSRPAGAQVSVDGQVMGTTPLTLPDVQPGAHRIVLEIPGFNQWITMARVTAGNRTRVAASLEQAQPQ